MRERERERERKRVREIERERGKERKTLISIHILSHVYKSTQYAEHAVQ